MRTVRTVVEKVAQRRQEVTCAGLPPRPRFCAWGPAAVSRAEQGPVSWITAACWALLPASWGSQGSPPQHPYSGSAGPMSGLRQPALLGRWERGGVRVGEGVSRAGSWGSRAKIRSSSWVQVWNPILSPPPNQDLGITSSPSLCLSAPAPREAGVELSCLWSCQGPFHPNDLQGYK